MAIFMDNNIRDLTELELKRALSDTAGKFAIYFYTPMCGTCKLAERMLHIAIQAGETIPIYKINVNFAPWFVRKWEIKSIPCLMIFSNQTPIHTMFAINSVQEIFQEIKK